MDPPPWWREAHPDDVMVWDRTPRAAPACRRGLAGLSPRRGRAAGGACRARGSQVRRPHVAGYHPCGQNTGEWFYQETWGPGLQGYAPARSAGLAGVAAGSGTATTRRCSTAWRDPQVTLATAAVPSPAARRAAPAGVLRDPVAERPLIDYAEFLQQMMADCVCQLAQAARQRDAGPQAGRVLLRLRVRVRRDPQRPVHGRPLRPAARAGLPRHRRALLADLLLRSRAGRKRPGHDRRRKRGPGRQAVALRGRHGDLPQHGHGPRFARRA